jgi:hypothetical protein
MAEAFRREGFDGVLYKSRLGPGCNLALFDLDSAHVEEVVLCRATGVEHKFAGYP